MTQISFGGMRSFSNEITVDGADFVNSISGVQRATPPQEAVQEFRVVNNSFGSEYGRALGGIVNIVTKSGTNDLHGSLYDYLQNSATNARSLFSRLLCRTFAAEPIRRHSGRPDQEGQNFFLPELRGKAARGISHVTRPISQQHRHIDQAKGYLGLSPEGVSCRRRSAPVLRSPISSPR